MAPQREWFEKDYYAVLGVPETADQKTITRAYRKKARATHPDANPGQEDRFKEVSAAYDVVGDTEKRKEYDEVRRLGAQGFAGFPGGAGGSGGNGGSSQTFRVEDLGDLGNLFGDLFGRGGRGQPGGQRRGAARRGADLEAELTLSFADAVHGVTTAVNLTSDAPCSTCGGSGARPGTSPVACPRCGGRGMIDDNQGLFSLSSPCPRCGGRGTVVESPCPTCNGTGTERRQRTVRVRVPAGVDDGQRIRLKGRGQSGRGGGPPGDLYVIVRVGAHPVFGRSGDNLTISVPVSFPEAALGADVEVPTLEGPTVTLRVPPGTRSGRTFRVKGRGVANRRGHGDLLVTVEVAVPAKLSDDQRRAIQDLAAAGGESPRAHLEGV